MQKWETLVMSRSDSDISFYPPGTVDTDWLGENYKFKVFPYGHLLEFDKGINSWEALQELLPYLGNEGWEPVGFANDADAYLFKRPIED